MAKIQPIQAYRPKHDIAKKVASRPYDVLNSEEARKEAEGNPQSFLHIIKSEIDLPLDIAPYDAQVYQKAKENVIQFIKEGTLVQDDAPHLYIYRLTMNDHSQTGIVAGSSIEDYFDDTIKKHEFTRPAKEKDRITHIKETGIHSGPVFLAYKHVNEIDTIIKEHTMHEAPDIGFFADDDIQHSIWVVKNEVLIEKLVNLFKTKVPATYIADGHHRAASTSKVGKALSEENAQHSGKEAYNSFLSVLFPDNQLQIFDYNRVVKDLNGLSKEAFLDKIKEKFEVQATGNAIAKPHEPFSYALYLENEAYFLKLKKEFYPAASDPIASLDIAVLSDLVLDPVLGISDQRTDERINFVGGIRGMSELKRLVTEGKYKCAFAIYPVTMKQLFDVADSGNVMPPKSTWFEPKLRSGLVVYPYRALEV